MTEENRELVEIPIRLPVAVAQKIERVAALAGIEPGQVLAVLAGIELLSLSASGASSTPAEARS